LVGNYFVDNYFLQNYKNLQVFPTKYFAKTILYKIFCKKIARNFLQMFFITKFVGISYGKNVKQI